MCGIFGVILRNRGKLDLESVLSSISLDLEEFKDNDSLAAGVAAYGLFQLQNRGQDSTGIVVIDNKGNIYHNLGCGLVEEVHTQPQLEVLKGHIVSGHNRYSTTGEPKPENIQPFYVEFPFQLTLAHNGNIINEKELRRILQQKLRTKSLEDKLIPKSTTDSELLLNLIAIELSECSSFQDALRSVLSNVIGSYSLIMTSKDKLIGVRDPTENRPLWIAKIDENYFLASEQRAIECLMNFANYRLGDGDFLREVKGGEIIAIQRTVSGTSIDSSFLPFDSNTLRLHRCSFEKSYLMRPDEGDVSDFRYRCGISLWQENPFERKENTIVTPVPDSGYWAAKGYSFSSGIEFVECIGRDHYFRKRTFIDPNQTIRELEARMKYYVIPQSSKCRKVILIDDSVIRSTTMLYLIKLLRTRGKVDEIHIRIATPPYITPCWKGIHTPEKDELIANGLTEKQVELFFMARFYGVDYETHKLKELVKQKGDISEIVQQSIKENINYLKPDEIGLINPKRFSLKYLGLDGFKKCFGVDKDKMCYACFIPDGKGYLKIEQKYLEGKV